jgi:four helix bundle protein
MFEHEKLEVYQLARELNREICRLTKIASSGPYDHINQVVRAGGSIPRNLAEGGGEWSAKEKAKFYRYAKRSAAECAASLDVLVDYEMLRESDIKQAKELLRRIIPMLVKLIQLFESGGPGRNTNLQTARAPSRARAQAPATSPGPGP